MGDRKMVMNIPNSGPFAFSLTWTILNGIMNLVHNSDGIPSTMHYGYFVRVKMLLCRHYPMLKGLRLSVVGVSEDLAVPHTLAI